MKVSFSLLWFFLCNEMYSSWQAKSFVLTHVLPPSVLSSTSSIVVKCKGRHFLFKPPSHSSSSFYFILLHPSIPVTRLEFLDFLAWFCEVPVWVSSSFHVLFKWQSIALNLTNTTWNDNLCVRREVQDSWHKHFVLRDKLDEEYSLLISSLFGLKFHSLTHSHSLCCQMPSELIHVTLVSHAPHSQS